MPESPDTPKQPGFQLTPIGGVRHGDVQPTMSTREIAEITGKRHDNVMRDARAMLTELHGPDLLKFEGVYQGGNGESRPCFNLPKRETLVLVSGYDIKMRAAIIDRWQDLENQQAQLAPVLALNNPESLRALLLENVEERIRLAEQVAAAAPKLEAFDRIAGADGSLCITDAAKSLQVRPKALFDFLRAHGWVYQPHGGRGDIAYAAKLQQGLMEHKTTTVHRSDGSEKIITQARITPKGLARLAQEFPAPAKAA